MLPSLPRCRCLWRCRKACSVIMLRARATYRRHFVIHGRRFVTVEAGILVRLFYLYRVVRFCLMCGIMLQQNCSPRSGYTTKFGRLPKVELAAQQPLDRKEQYECHPKLKWPIERPLDNHNLSLLAAI